MYPAALFDLLPVDRKINTEYINTSNRHGFTIRGDGDCTTVESKLMANEPLWPVICCRSGFVRLRVPMKAAGGKWDSKAKLWRAPYGAIKGTVLEKRIPAGYRKVKSL
jgi:hypothetical protein